MSYENNIIVDVIRPRGKSTVRHAATGVLKSKFPAIVREGFFR
jgi:hypothetical protein